MVEKNKCCVLIDDDEDDQLIFKSAIRSYFSSYSFLGLSSFNELKERINDFSTNEVSYTLFLDLNLPKTNGIEILEWLKNNPFFSTIPIVIYTTSKNPKDMERCAMIGVEGFVSKPSSVTELIQQLRIYL